MKDVNVRFVTPLFFLIMSAVLAMTAHALTISGENVGVGKDDPIHPLDIVGNVNADTFSGNGAGLTDISGENITGTVSESVIDPLICRVSELEAHASNTSLHPGYTDSEAVSAVKAADGPDSGLDADLLDGQHASDFASVSHDHDSGIIFRKVNGPGSYFASATDPFPEVSWDSDISIEVDGPANIIVDIGGRAFCEASGGPNTWVEVFPTIDGEQVGGNNAYLSTRSIIDVSFAEAGRMMIPDGTHILGLSARGQKYNTASVGCYLNSVWIKAVYE